MTAEDNHTGQQAQAQGPRPHAGTALPPRVAWALAGLACAAVIAVAALLGAGALAGREQSRARTNFASGTTVAAASAASFIERQEALGISTATYFAGNPKPSQADLLAWTRGTHLFDRNPELARLTLVGSGSASAPACEVLAGVARGVGSYPPVVPVKCGLSGTLRSAAAHGRPVYTPAASASQLGVVLPVYRGGTVPHASERSAALIGWMRAVITPGVAALTATGAPEVDAVVLSHSVGAGAASFAAGTAVRGAQSAVISLRGGWSAHILGPAVPGGMLAGGAPTALLAAGLALAVIVGLVVFLLGSAGAAAAGGATRSPEPQAELHDAVTSLPNQALMMDRTDRVLARVGRAPGMLAGALVVDVDSFTDINEKLGREAGDELLATVAQRLQGVVRDEDSVGRMGGDEFLVIVEATARSARLDRLASRILEALRKPIELDGFGPSFTATASIGLAFGRYSDPEQLLHDARLALYASKAAGKDRYTVFNANLRSVIEGRSVLEIDLDRALAEDQFSLIYQPVYDLGARRVTALEALIRWQHPKRGELLPADFIPIAEETGLIVPIGRWVLEQACMRAAAWNVAGHRVGVSVTVSRHQLDRDGFATDVLRALQQSGLPAQQLTLEVAEATVMEDVAAAAQRLLSIKQLGVKIAIDDFGRGYAYRSDLQRLPLDYLKVDRSSLAASEDEDYRSWLLEAILVFGRDLGLTVIAKGVESSEQLVSLQGLGCTLAQGSFLGEPARAEAVERLFDAQPVGGSAG